MCILHKIIIEKTSLSIKISESDNFPPSIVKSFLFVKNQHLCAVHVCSFCFFPAAERKQLLLLPLFTCFAHSNSLAVLYFYSCPFFVAFFLDLSRYRKKIRFYKLLVRNENSKTERMKIYARIKVKHAANCSVTAIIIVIFLPNDTYCV